MATPVGHALVGLATAEATGFRPLRSWRAVLTVVGLVVLPDIDILPGLIADNPGVYHGTLTNTLGAALLVAFVTGAFWSRRRRRFWPWVVVAFAVYASHIVVDLLMADPRNPRGMPLLLPFASVGVWNPLPLSEGVMEFFRLHWGPGTANFIEGVLSLHTLAIFGVELALFTPVLLVGRWLGRRSPLVLAPADLKREDRESDEHEDPTQRW